MCRGVLDIQKSILILLSNVISDARKQYQMKKKPKSEPLTEDSDSNLSCTLSLADISSDDDSAVLQNLNVDTPPRKGKAKKQMIVKVE